MSSKYIYTFFLNFFRTLCGTPNYSKFLFLRLLNNVSFFYFIVAPEVINKKGKIPIQNFHLIFSGFF